MVKKSLCKHSEEGIDTDTTSLDACILKGPNPYLTIVNSSTVPSSSPATPPVRPAGLEALVAWWTMTSHREEGFHSLFRLFLCVFFEMGRWRLHLEN
jgi:hypothetical protein